MKALSFYTRKISFLLLFILPALSLSAQKGTIKENIDSKTFVFKAETASPLTGGLKQLSGGYEVILNGAGLLDVYLPYFGRATAPPIDPTAGGIKFMSQNFDYKISDRKRGGWDITITPKDVTDIRSIMLTVFDNGSATLQVMSDRRDPITFNGTVVAYKPRTKEAR